MKEKSLPANDCVETVIRFYSDMVYRLAFARTGTTYNADEIYQEVFLRYIKKQPLFDSEEHRKAWFIRVTINCSKTFWASSWMKRTIPIDTYIDSSVPFETEEESDLHEQLQKLSPKYREVVHLFYYEELSIEEISQILDRKQSTVRTQLTRARVLLKDILDQEVNDDVQKTIPAYVQSNTPK